MKTIKNHRYLLGLVALPLIAVLGVSCSSDSDSVSAVLDAEGQSHLTVEIHDHHDPMIAECWVTVEDVGVHRRDQGWMAVGEHSRTFDLLTLVGGRTSVLGARPVPSGIYDRVRLHVTDAWLMLHDGSEIHGIVPPGGHHVELTLPEWCEVAEGEGATVSLDFRVDSSFHHQSGAAWSCEPDIVIDGVSHHGPHS